MTTKLAYEDVLDKFNAGTVSGKYGAIYVITVNPDTGLPYVAGGGGGGGGGDASAANQLSTLGTVAPGVAATKSTLVGGQFNSGTVVLTNGQQAAMQLDQLANGKVRIHGTTAAGADGVANNMAHISGHNQSSGNNAFLPVAQTLLNAAGTRDQQRGKAGAGFVVGAPLTNTNRSAAVGTTTQVLAAANASRSGLVLQNIAATGDIWYAFGIPAVVGGLGCFKLIPGATFFMETNVVDTAAVNVIATAAATNLSALEY